MKLPRAADVQIPRRKLEGYLLSSTHPAGRFKARFFRALGFDGADQLERALRELAGSGTISAEVPTTFGRKYIVDGLLKTPRGTRVALRTVWIQERETEAPRLVTAYPW